MKTVPPLSGLVLSHSYPGLVNPRENLKRPPGTRFRFPVFPALEAPGYYQAPSWRIAKNLLQHITAGNGAYSKGPIAISFLQCGDFFFGGLLRGQHGLKWLLPRLALTLPGGPPRFRTLKISPSKLA